jgi:hypothetical protein
MHGSEEEWEPTAPPGRHLVEHPDDGGVGGSIVFRRDGPDSPPFPEDWPG